MTQVLIKLRLELSFFCIVCRIKQNNRVRKKGLLEIWGQELHLPPDFTWPSFSSGAFLFTSHSTDKTKEGLLVYSLPLKMERLHFQSALHVLSNLS